MAYKEFPSDIRSAESATWAQKQKFQFEFRILTIFVRLTTSIDLSIQVGYGPAWLLSETRWLRRSWQLSELSEAPAQRIRTPRDVLCRQHPQVIVGLSPCPGPRVDPTLFFRREWIGLDPSRMITKSHLLAADEHTFRDPWRSHPPSFCQQSP